MTCSTCRQFRQGVVARLGFCAADRTREPLSGDEIRACWQAPSQVEPTVGLFAMVEQMQAELRGSEHLQPALASQPARPLSQVLARPSEARATSVRARDPVGTGDARRREPLRGLRTLPSAPTAATRPPEPRPVGRLLEAPLVAPALRLGSRGDARSLLEQDQAQPPRQVTMSAAEPLPQDPPVAPIQSDSSVDGERGRALDGGAVL